MKILEPVEQSAIPRPEIRYWQVSKYQELYDRVLSLNGKALPVEFEDVETASRQARSWRAVKGACARQGIRISQRFNVLYLSKRP